MSEKSKHFVHGLTGWIILLLERALRREDTGEACFAFGVRGRVQNTECYEKMSGLGRWCREEDWAAQGYPKEPVFRVGDSESFLCSKSPQMHYIFLPITGTFLQHSL